MGTLKAAIDSAVKSEMRSYLNSDKFETHLVSALDPHIEDILTRNFQKKPDTPLSEIGFGWAWIIAIKTFWPDMKRRDAMRELHGYMPDLYGHPDYDWSYSMALEMAREYVSEYGEAI